MPVHRSPYEELKSNTNLHQSYFKQHNPHTENDREKHPTGTRRNTAKVHVPKKMFLKIQPAGSALPVCLLQIKSSLGSPSAQVFVLRELRTDHDVGKQSTNKKRQLASTDVLACTRSLKTLSCDIPVFSVGLRPLETCNSAFAADCLTQTGCFSFSVIIKPHYN